MEILRGPRALTPFRTIKLLSKLQLIDPAISAVNAEFIHFVHSEKPLSKADVAQAQVLLPAADPDAAASASATLFLVVPRPGTISPWSSKATDIMHNCGLTKVIRVERGTAYHITADRPMSVELINAVLYDRMTESVLSDLASAERLFTQVAAQPLTTIVLMEGGKAALLAANTSLGLALAPDEVDYLFDAYMKLKRDPTDVELMMFAQVNSEHCRHKIFNADWTIDGKPAEKSLFSMIKNTYEQHHDGVLSAYSDNAAVIKGSKAARFFADPADQTYRYHEEPMNLVIKVETHNHPTAIAPAQGAATGVGGEIRDEGATGRGAKSKMGLAGYSVSNLAIPGYSQPWETLVSKPSRIASPLSIMLDAPIGAAAFSNEFGRPTLTGYFRTYEQAIPEVDTATNWGYHKPIMIAGGLGTIRDEHVQKHPLPIGAYILVLGGPAMLIGLGGGAASSMQTGTSLEDLDFASVQRANAEMEHRVQEVIDQCWAKGSDNPIISIHDVGAGGLSNALPEIVHDAGVGAHFELRDVPSAEPGLSPMEIWCNEAQERYVLGIDAADLPAFEALCKRERCPYAVVGTTTKNEQLVVSDALLKTVPVDLPMSVLFGKPPKMTRHITTNVSKLTPIAEDTMTLLEAAKRVLQLPSVGSKKFLISLYVIKW
jgi:phosphoribosylformylglycinamidine synthase